MTVLINGGRESSLPLLSPDVAPPGHGLAQQWVQQGLLDQLLAAALRSAYGGGASGGNLPPGAFSAPPAPHGFTAPGAPTAQPFAAPAPPAFTPHGGMPTLPELLAPPGSPAAAPSPAAAGAPPAAIPIPIRPEQKYFGAMGKPVEVDRHGKPVAAPPASPEARPPAPPRQAAAPGGPSHAGAPQAGGQQAAEKPQRGKADPISTFNSYEREIAAPANGLERSSHAGSKHEQVSGSGANQSRTLEQTGAWARSSELAEVRGGNAVAAGYGEAAVGAKGEASYKASGSKGSVEASAQGQAGAEARGYGRANAGVGGLNLQAGGLAKGGLFGEAGTELSPARQSVNLGGVNLDLTPSIGVKGRAMLGGEAGGTGFLGVQIPTPAEMAEGMRFKAGAEASGSAFAGAKAEGELSAGIGGNKLGVSGGVMAGVGIEGKASATVAEVNGKKRLKLELKLGAALGIGASLGIKLDINVQPLVDAFKAVKNVGKKIVKGVSNAVGKVKQHFNNVGDAFNKAKQEAGGGVKGFFAGIGAGIKKFFGG